MGWLDDITQALMQQPDSSAPGAPMAILPTVAQTDPTPVVAGAPMDITSQAQKASLSPPTKSKGDDWTPPAVTMTPPAVAAVPFGRSSGMIAAQPTPAMMGDVLNAPQKAPRRQYAVLTTPTFG